jgi:predicted ATP-dependent serine protease
MKKNSHNLDSDQIQGKGTKKNSSIRPNGDIIYEKKENDTQKILSSAKALKINVNDELLPPQIAWQLKNLKSDGYSTLGTLGNFSLIIGKAKSRKSFFISIAVSTAVSKDLILERFKSNLPKEQKEVLYFDTEQSKYYVQLALKRICKQIGIDEPPNLSTYHLRSKTPAERLAIIEAVIYSNDKIGFVVIDGIKDLITSINDEEQASMIASKLLKWTEERNIHIVTVLHENKSNNNARGHIGTELINKAETVLSITKAEGNNDISIVEPQQCRNIEPESFAFEINDNGLPIIAENFEARAKSKITRSDVIDLDDIQKYQLLVDVFNNGSSFLYGKLIAQLRLSHKKILPKNLGKNKAVGLIKYCKNKGWLLQEKPKEPYTLGSFKENPPV